MNRIKNLFKIALPLVALLSPLGNRTGLALFEHVSEGVRRTFLLTALFISVAYTARGQQSTLKQNLLRITQISDSLGKARSPEKIYLQLDKPYYALGDTVWFKAYLLDNYLAASAKSVLLNIDLVNDSDKAVRSYRFRVYKGSGSGNFALENEAFRPGTYTLRAWTDWQRNFGPGYFFYKTITVAGAGSNQVMIASGINAAVSHDSLFVKGMLRFSDSARLPWAARPVSLSLLYSGKQSSRQKFTTGVDGVVNLNFKLPQKNGSLAIIADDDKRERIGFIPVPQAQTGQADVQFMPEGGNLVAGLPAHIGFKAIDVDGRGVDISGVVIDSRNKQVAAFQSLHKGMGSFDLDVMPGETYAAQVTLPRGTIKEYVLPQVKNTGTVLLIKKHQETDSLAVEIGAIGDARGQYFLIGRARGVVCYAAIVNLQKGGVLKRLIAQSNFPDGIAHFTLMTAKNQPVNERLVYIDHGDQLKINITGDKTSYNPRDSVALHIRVTDKDGAPVSGAFSLAVTDDNQLKPGAINRENILSSMLLSGELKGYVEDPAYYLSSQSPGVLQALDNLLLTQGWLGYDWSQVFNPPPLTFAPQTDFSVTGYVHNLFNKPVAGTHVLLFSQSPKMLIDTVTDAAGRFVFDRMPRIDSPAFMLRAVNKKNKSFNVRIAMDEHEPPEFKKPFAPLTMPWYVNTDTAMTNFTASVYRAQQLDNVTSAGHMLKEVKIKDRKVIKDSQNLNGPGNADFVFDQKDLEAAGHKTWLQLLQENIKGFSEGQFHIFGSGQEAVRQGLLRDYVTDFFGNGIYTPDPNPGWYFVNGNPVKIIVDGIDLNQVINAVDFRSLRDYLSHTAEAIRGMEVISSPKFTSMYLDRYDPINPKTGKQLLVEIIQDYTAIFIGPQDVSFIEITTRGSHGPWLDNKPGMYMYRGMPISATAQFYKPKYTLKDANSRPDYRATIDWEPNIVTDSKGEANVWFYAAGSRSTYTLTLQGADMNGTLGFKQDKIEVGSVKEKSK